MPKRLVRFGLVGLTSTIATFVLYRTLLLCGVGTMTTVFVTWAAGLFIAFRGNKRLTFDVRTRVSSRELVSFFIGYGLQLIIGILGFTLTLDYWRLPPSLAYIVVLIPTAVVSFLFMQLITFKQREPGSA
jgi:putative flippase GtrA